MKKKWKFIYIILLQEVLLLNQHVHPIYLIFSQFSSLFFVCAAFEIWKWSFFLIFPDLFQCLHFIDDYHFYFFLFFFRDGFIIWLLFISCRKVFSSLHGDDFYELKKINNWYFPFHHFLFDVHLYVMMSLQFNNQLMMKYKLNSKW